MGWQKYRELFRDKSKIDERHFILGVDLGAQTASLAFFNPISREPEIIDMSGGYGKPNIPTAAQYIAETGEWVFGEYAMLNGGGVVNLAKKLGQGEFVSPGGKRVAVNDILGLFTKELIGACNNLNPKAEIAGIAVCVPSYIDDEGKKALLGALEKAGHIESVVATVPDRECALARLYFDREVKRENVLLLDFGAREARGGVYAVEPAFGKITVRAVSSLFDAGVGTGLIDSAAYSFFTDFYNEKTGTKSDRKPDEQILSQLSAFSYQHKDLLFQKNKSGKSVKAYYNFAYPPFALEISPGDSEDLLRPYKAQFSVFLADLIKRSEGVTKRDIAAVVCAGGGFEMPWAREAVTKAFPYSDVKFYKNPKGVAAEGAAILAAGELNAAEKKIFVLDDIHQLKSDIGIMTTYNGEREFYPLIKKNSFWWQNVQPRLFTVNEKTDKPLFIEFYKRGEKIEQLGKLTIDGLPPRPEGTTRLKLSLEFLSGKKLKVTVKDYGFGAFYPAGDYGREFVLEV